MAGNRVNFTFYFTCGLLTVTTTAYPSDSDFMLGHRFVRYADDSLDGYRHNV